MPKYILLYGKILNNGSRNKLPPTSSKKLRCSLKLERQKSSTMSSMSARHYASEWLEYSFETPIAPKNKSTKSLTSNFLTKKRMSWQIFALKIRTTNY